MIGAKPIEPGVTEVRPRFAAPSVAGPGAVTPLWLRAAIAVAEGPAPA